MKKYVIRNNGKTCCIVSRTTKIEDFYSCESIEEFIFHQFLSFSRRENFLFLLNILFLMLKFFNVKFLFLMKYSLYYATAYRIKYITLRTLNITH